MGWARFDDCYTDHPKIVAAGPWCELLDMRAILYCARYETDGRIHTDALPRISVGIPAAKTRARTLVVVGRWAEISDGWEVLDYLEYNPSRKDKDAGRAAARDRMAKVRGTPKFARSSPERTPELPPKFARSSPYPDPTPIDNSSLVSLPRVTPQPVENCERCQGRGTYWNAGAGKDVMCQCVTRRMHHPTA